MGVGNKKEVCLLLSQQRQQIFCMCASAFEVADMVSFSNKKLKEDIGSLVICKDGSIKKISMIKKIGLVGESILEKIRSFIFGEYIIQITFEETSLTLRDIIAIIKKYINDNPIAYDYLLINEENETEGKRIILSKIDTIESIQELFDLLHCHQSVCLETF